MAERLADASTDDPANFAENRAKGLLPTDRALTLPPLTPPRTAERGGTGGANRPVRRNFAQMVMWEINPQHAAASLFARAWRKRCARRDLARAVQARFMKVYDANSGFYYFVDNRTRAVSWEPPKVLWNDERYRVTSKRDGVDHVAIKRDAMARAATKIMTPRSWADKHKPKVNLESMREEESDADGSDSDDDGDDDSDDGGDDDSDDAPLNRRHRATDRKKSWVDAAPDNIDADY